MKKNPIFTGIKSMLPIIPGVIPFGLIMGTAASNAGLSVFEAFGMNLLVLAGAAQLVTVDLMSKNVDSIIIVFTGCIINLRMMLYSASMSPVFKEASFLQKTFASYMLTDQAYAISLELENQYDNLGDRLKYFFGGGTFMVLCWHVSVVLGMFFGNFAPASLSLDFAVPLTFMALMIPSLKNKNYFYVAACSATLSILLYDLPYNLGLICSAGLGVLLGTYLSRKREGVSNEV
jgi:predicted branched-subunit amino acid permease